MCWMSLHACCLVPGGTGRVGLGWVGLGSVVPCCAVLCCAVLCAVLCCDVFVCCAVMCGQQERYMCVHGDESSVPSDVVLSSPVDDPSASPSTGQ